MTSWSIAIKTVGSRVGGVGTSSTTCAASSSNSNSQSTTLNLNPSSIHSDTSESNFTIEVNPDDPLHSLHEKIELVTGLKAEQQRLIYRGRIINSGQSRQEQNNSSNSRHQSQSGGNGGGRALTEAERLLGDHDGVPSPPSPPPPQSPLPTAAAAAASINTPRVRDVNGLCDQQTIHLVPRPNALNNNNNNNNNNDASTTINNSNSNNSGSSFGNNAGGIASLLGGMDTSTTGGSSSGGTSVTSLSGEAGMSLLAALLGIPGSGSSGESSNGGTSTNNNSSSGTGSGSSVLGNTEGLGGIVERAAMMGVLDEDAPSLLGGTAGLGGLGGGSGSILGFASGSSDTAGGTTTLNTNGGRPTVRSPTTRESETFPRLAPINNNTRQQRQRRNNTRTPGAQSAASRAARARASAARLTEADVRVADPGSVEPVRQGLLTLHTLLGNAQLDQDDNFDGDGAPSVLSGSNAVSAINEGRSNRPVRAPLDSHRQWYRGQWLDALDTVNQWLEATIVDIVLPSDVLPSYHSSISNSNSNSNNANNDATTTSRNPRRRTRRSTPDAVVSANDLEGRRRLLLEPIPDHNDNDLQNNSESEGPYHLLDEGYRPRPDNANVQLLLIHYNGWPHRWDEWIRSDSERLRPFRTRTRHRGSAVGSSVGGGRILHCPTPNAVFGASPSTCIKSEEDDHVGVEEERGAVLVELERVMESVHGLLNEAIGQPRNNNNNSGENADQGEEDDTRTYGSRPAHLPWRTSPPARPVNNYSALVESLLGAHPWDGNVPPSQASVSTTLNTDTAISNTASAAEAAVDADADADADAEPRHQLDAAQLRQLAPLLDRLGRALTDAAPHVAALADSLPVPTATPVSATPASSSSNRATYPEAEEVGSIQSLAARASHLYFGMGDNGEDDDGEESANNEDISDNTMTGATALRNSVDAPASSSAAVSATSNTVSEQEVVEEETIEIVDPDLTDYVNGMVNTTRGGNGNNSGSGGRSGDRDSNIGTSLLANYLSSMAAGGSGGGSDNTNNPENPRFIRVGGSSGVGSGLGGALGGSGGGGGGPGIDIHIHAIVTGPGMPPGGVTGGLGGLGGLMDLGLGGGGTTTTTTTTAPRNNDSPFFNTAPDTPTNNNHNEEDMDLFSELYSASPDPVNLHAEDDENRVDSVPLENVDGDNWSRLFDDIEEEAAALGSVESTEEEADLTLAELSVVDTGNVIADTEVAANPIRSSDDGPADDSSSSSILALSEIESQEGSMATRPPTPSSSMTPSSSPPGTRSSTPSPSSSATAPTRLVTTSLTSSSSLPLSGGGNNSSSSRSSPSFSNRLFRRTFGRLSGSASRRSGGSSHGS